MGPSYLKPKLARNDRKNWIYGSHEKNFLIKKKKYNSHELPKINWGRGRLSKYQSLTSFAAKFCRLNDLTPLQFRRFFVEVVEDTPDSYYFQQYRDDINESVIKQIALILDEPLSTVRTAFCSNRLGWGDLAPYRNIFDKHEIGYCPQCLTEGYHGYFHECPWLKKCPIHYIDIQVKRIGTGTKFDQRVRELSLLFDQYCPEWYIPDGKYLSEL